MRNFINKLIIKSVLWTQQKYIYYVYVYPHVSGDKKRGGRDDNVVKESGSCELIKFFLSSFSYFVEERCFP